MRGVLASLLIIGAYLLGGILVAALLVIPVVIYFLTHAGR